MKKIIILTSIVVAIGLIMYFYSQSNKKKSDTVEKLINCKKYPGPNFPMVQCVTTPCIQPKSKPFTVCYDKAGNGYVDGKKTDLLMINMITK